MFSTASVFVIDNTCQKPSTAGAVVGFVVIAAFIAAIVILAIANARARSQLAAANGELNYLRYENVRLQNWQSGATGSPTGSVAGSPYPTHSPISPQWHPDPTGRHELRLWDGSAWSGDVSDQGVISKDPPG